LVAAPVLCLGFALLPTSRVPAQDELRTAYLRDLRRYEGTSYVWGGESPLGIDCSGLVRRGLIDTNIRLGVQRFSPLSLRRAASLWWHDCTAQALGDPATGWTCWMDGDRRTARRFCG
jgi:cell wall-associated NlpC family hydrolase